MEPTTTTKASANGSQSKAAPEGWESWLTAGEVSRRLRCARTHVYRLEQRGELRCFDGVSHGKRVRRFDPASVSALAPTDDELDDELADELEGSNGADTTKLVARMLTEARSLTTDARKGQHEAYQLIAVPSRELHGITLGALKQQAERIRELEQQLNKMYDEQRDARRDDREFTLLERQLGEGEARKDKFFQMLVQVAPEVLGQLVSTMKAGAGAAGPLAEWMKAKTPEQQRKLIQAIEVVMAIDEEARTPATAPPDGFEERASQ